MVTTLWLRFRTELRSRWVGWLALAILTGIVAGAVLLSAAGAKRTASAYQRFLTQSHRYDVLLGVHCGPPEPTPSDTPTPPTPACTKRAAAVPAIAAATVAEQFPGFVTTARGRSLQPAPDTCYSGPGQVSAIGDRSGRFGTTINRTQIVRGRAPDPTRPDEVVLTRRTADEKGVQVDDVLRLRPFNGADCLDPPEKWADPISLRVVGIGHAPGEIPPASGLYFGVVHVTPAFVRAHTTLDHQSLLVVRLERGATRAELISQLRAIDTEAEIIFDLADQTQNVERAIRPQATTLWLFSALVGLAGAVVLGQLLVRQQLLDAGDDAVLRALGMRRRDLAALGAARGLLLGLVAALIATIVAVAASPTMPVGLARTVEPDPGIVIDGWTLLIGTLGVVMFVALISTITAWRAGSTRAHPAVSVRNQLVLGRALNALRLPLRSASGIRMALDPRGTGTRVPIRSSIAAIGVGVLTLTGALTFGSSLDHLLATPRLMGWNWDVVAFDSGGDSPVDPRAVVAALRDHPDIEAFTGASFWPPFPQGVELRLGPRRIPVGMFGFGGAGPIGPSLIEGRAPRRADEILVGPHTLDELDLSVGDPVVAYGQAGTWEEPGAHTRARFRIVGTGVLPSGVGDRLGRGATMTIGGLAKLNPDSQPDGYWLRLRRGATPARVVAQVQKRLGATPTKNDPGYFTIDQLPKALALSDTEQLRSSPLQFSLVMGAMSMGVLAYVLVSAVRARRRDLAVLRTLGMRDREIRTSIRWQARTYVVVASFVAAPIGVVIGRFAWRIYADRLGVVPEPTVPWLTLVLVGLGASVVATVIAIPVARRATRSAPGPALRSE